MAKRETLIGKQFGDLEVLSYLGDSLWECRCKCGNIEQVKTGKLTSGRKTRCLQCSKENDPRRIDLTGRIIGNWKVLEYIGDRYWKCQCLGCGQIINVRGNSLRDGKSTQCSKCAIKAQAKPLENLEGLRFGDLEVKKYIGKSMWECQCSCGNEILARSDHLRNGKINNCGDINRHSDLVNKQIGEWKVLEYAGNQYWKCKCSCGVIKNVHAYSLRNGISKSCGAPVHKTKYNLVGMTFGKLKVIDYLGNMKYRCKCECGNQTDVLTCNLINGSTRSCGCSTIENMQSTLLNRYGDINPYKAVTSPRDQWQIEVIKDREAFTSFFTNQCINNKKLTYKDAAKMLGLTPASIARYCKMYQCEDLFDTLAGKSNMEQDLCDYIISITNEDVIQSDRSVLKGRELDIYIPSKKLAIEFNGTYWHSDIYKHKNYHQDKTVQCAKLGIRLIHIFEYEWIDTENRVKLQRYLKDILLDKKEVIYGRLTTVSVISSDTANEFIDKYHLQGIAQASIRYGLYRETELIGVLTLGKPRFNNNYEYEVIRLCWKPGILVIGGLEKLFKTFIKDYNPSSIITYCDIGKFTGNSYTRINFKVTQDSLTRPNYVWVKPDTNEVLQRYQTQKHKLIANGFGTESDTEDSIMEQLGFLKIYDAGNIRLVYNK